MSSSPTSKDTTTDTTTDIAPATDTTIDTATKDNEKPYILCDELHPDVVNKVKNNMHTVVEEYWTIMKLQVGTGQAVNGRMDAGAKRGFSAVLDTDTGRLRIDAVDPEKAAFWLEVDTVRLSQMVKKQKTGSEEADASESNESEEPTNSAE
jgi:hypothetical protein